MSHVLLSHAVVVRNAGTLSLGVVMLYRDRAVLCQNRGVQQTDDDASHDHSYHDNALSQWARWPSDGDTACD